ncbi:hypothetical protein GGR55DRAFT_645059 [Xylaria sp. FL0064]|nr:hypothetical protein GGR55DRAFT_645059 [Xylaria sp. FL0064]
MPPLSLIITNVMLLSLCRRGVDPSRSWLWRTQNAMKYRGHSHHHHHLQQHHQHTPRLQLAILDRLQKAKPITRSEWLGSHRPTRASAITC